MTATQLAKLIDWVFENSGNLLLAFVLLILVLALIVELGKWHDRQDK